jgi:hypothetical protein
MKCGGLLNLQHPLTPTRYLQTPVFSNAPAETITQVKNVALIPDTVKHQRVQQALAAQIAHNPNQVQPTKQDLEMAFFKYGEAQSQANKELELKQRKVAAMGKRVMSKRIGS